jgi:hypothetical protein
LKIIAKELWVLFRILCIHLFRKRKDFVDNGKVVVFNTVSLLGHHAAIELELAREYCNRGWKAFLLIDDGAYPMTDKFQYAKGMDLNKLTLFKQNDRFQIAKLKIQLYQWFFTYYHPNIKIIWMSSIQDKIKTDAADSKDDKHIKSSLIRFFQDEYPEEFSDFESYKLKVVQTASFSRSLGEYVYGNLKPDLFITGHGIYVTWGPILDYLKEKEVRAYIYSMPGYISGTIRMIDVVAQSMMYAESWQKFRKNKLTSQQMNESKAIFERRVNKEALDTKEYAFESNDLERFKRFKAKYSYCIGAFPNVIWDGNVEERNSVFNGITEWIVTTIQTLENKNIGLIIRFHPAEFRRLKARPLEEIIRNKIPHLDSIENVLIISSDQTMDTYFLCNHFIDVGITYDGNLSMEIPYLGTPLIAAGKGRLSQPYWCYMPKTIEEYAEWLITPQTLIDSFENDKHEMKEEILKFNYWMNVFSAIQINTLKRSKKIREIENPLKLISKLKNIQHSILDEFIEKDLIEKV